MTGKILAVIALTCFFASVPAVAQGRKFDLVIRNGHVIDPRNGIDATRDIAVADGKIALVDASIPGEQATTTIDAQGLYVTPGLVDLHVHVFYGTHPNSDYSDGFLALPPDGFTLSSGVTTAVDVGGSGWRDFIQFKEQVIDRSTTRIFALLNIVGSGMKGGPIEQNTGDMDPKLTAMRARQFRDIVVGVKVAHFEGHDWTAVDRAVEAGNLAGIPVMVDFGSADPPLSLADLLVKHLRPGDILTHMYAQVRGRESIVGPDGKLQAFAGEARKRGIVFDVGHGAGSFAWSQAVPATTQGFWPDTISTDLHYRSMLGGMKNQLNVMSKLLSLGLPLKQVILQSTWAPARVIHREGLGHLTPGAEADIAILRLRQGQFGFVDVTGARKGGTQKLECEATIKTGRVVWDLNGIASKEWK